MFVGIEPQFCGTERANFARESEDPHPRPGRVAVMGEMLAVPRCFGLAKGVGQKKDRHGHQRVRLHALHGHVKKPSDIESNICLANSEAYCCVCIYIFGFGIPWSGLSVKSFLALVPVQNGGGRSSSKNSLCQKSGVVTTPIF